MEKSRSNGSYGGQDVNNMLEGIIKLQLEQLKVEKAKAELKRPQEVKGRRSFDPKGEEEVPISSSKATKGEDEALTSLLRLLLWPSSLPKASRSSSTAQGQSEEKGQQDSKSDFWQKAFSPPPPSSSSNNKGWYNNEGAAQQASSGDQADNQKQSSR